ncbi:MAG: hypothetical protein JXQ79_10205 [Rhodobacteraceae bacterium]|nr:hypothetical protein [Paracoccaceae bacterium]
MMDLTFKERTFDEAFAEARRLNLSSFMWRGRPYHTERADERGYFEVGVRRCDMMGVPFGASVLKNPLDRRD